MSSLCKRLERDGYLRRERDSSDERIVRAIATQKTLDIFGSIDQTLHARFAALAETLSEEDLQCIIDGITKLDMLLDRLPLTDGKE